MSDDKHKSVNDSKSSTASNGVNPVVAGVVGVAVGAAAGIAAVELAKKENRKAIGDKFEELKAKGEEVVSGIGKIATEAKDAVTDLSSLGDDKAEDNKGDKDSKAHARAA